MSNADRLREAARFMETSQVPDDQATAALLRAVADDLEIGLYIVGAESPAAALALAATILGSDR